MRIDKIFQTIHAGLSFVFIIAAVVAMPDLELASAFLIASFFAMVFSYIMRPSEEKQEPEKYYSYSSYK